MFFGSLKPNSALVFA